MMRHSCSVRVPSMCNVFVMACVHGGTCVNQSEATSLQLSRRTRTAAFRWRLLIWMAVHWMMICWTVCDRVSGSWG